MNITITLYEKDTLRADVLGPGGNVGRFIAVRLGDMTVYLHGDGEDAATSAETLAGLLSEAAAELLTAEQKDAQAAIEEQEREPDPDTAFESRRLTIQGGR